MLACQAYYTLITQDNDMTFALEASSPIDPLGGLYAGPTSSLAKIIQTSL